MPGLITSLALAANRRVIHVQSISNAEGMAGRIGDPTHDTDSSGRACASLSIPSASRVRRLVGCQERQGLRDLHRRMRRTRLQ
jgi:hypothetical protein